MTEPQRIARDQAAASYKMFGFLIKAPHPIMIILRFSKWAGLNFSAGVDFWFERAKGMETFAERVGAHDLLKGYPTGREWKEIVKEARDTLSKYRGEA